VGNRCKQNFRWPRHAVFILLCKSGNGVVTDEKENLHSLSTIKQFNCHFDVYKTVSRKAGSKAWNRINFEAEPVAGALGSSCGRIKPQKPKGLLRK